MRVARGSSDRHRVYGPFDAPRTVDRKVEKEDLNGLWDVVEDELVGLARASGWPTSGNCRFALLVQGPDCLHHAPPG